MERGNVILAIDLGTTRCKATSFDLRGAMLAGVSRETDEPEWVGEIDRNVAKWKRDVLWCARSAIKATEREIDRIVVTGQGSSAVWLDEKGELVCPVILHTDNRAARQAETLGREIENLGYVSSKVFRSLLWLRENETTKFRSIKHVLDIRQFIGYELTGEMRYDVRSLSKLENEKFGALSGLDPQAFGEPHDYREPIGYLKASVAEGIGLSARVPVFVGPMDGLCGIIGSGICQEGQMADVAGSTEVMSTPVPRGSKLGVLPLLDTGVSLYYTSPPYGLAYKWFLENFYDARRSPHELLGSDVVASSVNPEGPFYVPGLEPAGFHSNLRGAFFNLRVGHSRRDLARALLEGIAFAVAQVVRDLEGEGVMIKEIRLSGGGAYQGVWNQIRADVTGKDNVLPRVLETTCLGAAVVAASSSYGPYKDVIEGMSRMVRMGKRYRPRAAASKAYRERRTTQQRYAELLTRTF